MFELPIFLLVILFFSFGHCQVNYFQRRDISEGQVFPAEMDVIAGETLYLRLIPSFSNQLNCTYRHPGGGVDIVTPISVSDTDKVTGWLQYSCAIRINNASLTDSGHWRLTSTNGVETRRGVAIILVQSSNTTETIDDVNQLITPQQKISVENVQYCYVIRSDQEKNEFPKHDDCIIPQVNKELDSNGMWTIAAGVEGQTKEIIFQINVTAQVEQMATSIEFSNNNELLQFKCNIDHTNKIITFCRFYRTIDDMGFNVQEGIGNTKYSYFGDGFNKGHCGLSIRQPDSIDLSTWKCFVGFTMDGNNRDTWGAILDASPQSTELEEIEADEDVYGLNGTDVNILCTIQMAIDYCWFTHPNGRRISVSDKSINRDDDNFRYFGTGLKLGDCGVTILTADLADDGKWHCHLGTLDRLGFDTRKEINVRISDSHLVAQYKHRDVFQNIALVLDCTTIPVRLPLDYCRFVLPNGEGFSISESITQANALQGLYYFNPNRQLDHGYCSIVIRTVNKAQHEGTWTCAGRLHGREEESGDDFTVDVLENGLSAASILGMVFGGIIIMAGIIYVGVRSYRKKLAQGLINADGTTESRF